MKDFYPKIVIELKKLADEARTDLGDDLQNVKGFNQKNSSGLAQG